MSFFVSSEVLKLLWFSSIIHSCIPCCLKQKFQETTTATFLETTSTSIDSCGQNWFFRDTKIIGGNEADEEEYPWIVRLSIGGSNAFCAGVIIDANWVLTAAHCLDHVVELENITMVFGDFDRTQIDMGEITRQPTAMYMHPAYMTLDYDFGLLKFEEPLDFSEWNIQKVCLPSRDCDPAICGSGADVYIAGWGDVDMQDNQTKILKEAKLTILNDTDCKQRWAPSVIITERMVCAVGLNSDESGACYGDSGGPMMELKDGRYTLCGVISFVPGEATGCGHAYYGTVFAKVCKAIDWIEGMINCEEDPVDRYCPTMCTEPCPFLHACVATETCECLLELLC